MRLIKNKKASLDGGGLVLLPDVYAAMQGEKVLKNAGYAVALVAPPPALRRGCDLGLEINLVEQIGIERELQKAGVDYLSVQPMAEQSLRPLRLVKVTDFGDSIMVRAGNMKVAFDKKTGVILNTSGGGCPDVPYMHFQLVDRRLDEAPRPRDIGATLCALMLDRALEESLSIYQNLREAEPR